MDIKQNYFEFLGLPEAYELDLQALAERSRELQKTLHPDRFSHLSDRERRLSVQYTAYLNEAIATLKSPLRRCQYLLLLKGVDTISESSVALDPVFLMEQMELREELESVRDGADSEVVLERLQGVVDAELVELRRVFKVQFEAGDQSSLEAAAMTVRKMQFIDKLGREIDALEDQLYD